VANKVIFFGQTISWQAGIGLSQMPRYCLPKKYHLIGHQS
jgi:hypothetical protein